MSPSRAWQQASSTKRGIQRLSCVELDFARTPGGRTARLEYVPLVAPDRTVQMARVAEFMSAFGPQAPVPRGVLVVARGDEEAFSERYPDVEPPTHRGATVVAADSGEIAVLSAALERGQLVVCNSRPQVADSTPPFEAARIAAVLETVWADERVLYQPGGKSDFRSPSRGEDTIDLLVPMSTTGGMASEAVSARSPAVAFNAGYFLWIEEETRDPYSFTLDHAGLLIRAGEVLSPPIFRRSAVLVSGVYGRESDEKGYSIGAPRISIRELSLANVSLRIGTSLMVHGSDCEPDRLPGEHRLPPSQAHAAELNPAAADGETVAFYTRTLGAADGGTCVETPRAEDRIEFVVTGREVCAVKRGGPTYIPMNGFVLSLPSNLGETLLGVLADEGHRVRYAIDAGDGAAPVSGVQVGSRLVRDGERLDVAARFAAGVEEFHGRDPDRGDEGIPPVYYTRERHINSTTARIGLGLRPDARCYVLVLEGCEPRTAFPAWDSAGVTMDELADTLTDLGCTEVVQLDGGGSAALFFDGRPMVKGADRNDIAFLAAERAVPGAWMVWE